MYLQGFGNYHQSEAIKDALPREQNSPQHTQFGLYAEQLSGSAFTRPRHSNWHSWLYRTHPSAAQGIYSLYHHQIVHEYHHPQSPNALRWSPLSLEAPEHRDFVSGLFHIAGNTLNNVFIYDCNQSMTDTYFASNDGELLFIPYEGTIKLHTELGILEISSGTIAVIPRGIKFKVVLSSAQAKGYLCENGGLPFTLPHLGAIGANGLAHPRHFEYPTAAYEKKSSQSTLICKNQQYLWAASYAQSPLNVVAWHGNYAPYRYNLNLFNTINTVSFDHPDPSIFTLLTSESDTAGVANLDFVIFPPRWMVAEHSFRPPYFHRNYMNELMGLVHGTYDAKKEGFNPGGISLHNCMTPHGPDRASYTHALSKNLVPEYQDVLAFMLETKDFWQVTQQAINHQKKQDDYIQCWDGFNNVMGDLP